MASTPESRFCHCCAPPSERTPMAIWNRPGLPALVVRAGTFATFREAMLQDIVRQAELAALGTRDSDDYATTAIELFAAVADVLTFYTERIANEMYLGTARERDSLLRLVRLIGYRLRPGLAATTMLSFTIDAGQTTRIRKGLKVMSIPAQDERPMVFETIEALVADARLNAPSAYAPPLPANAFRQGSAEAPLVARPASLGVGDRFLVFGANVLEEKTVTALSAARDGERLSFTPGIQADILWPAVARAARVDRRLRFFGHDAPDRYQAFDTNPATPPAQRWRTIVAGTAGYDLSFAANALQYPLDSRIETLAPGARLLVDAGPSANPRYRTATVTAVGDAPAILGNVANTAPHRSETVTHAALVQTVRGRPAIIVHATGLHAAARSGVGRTLAISAGDSGWTALASLVAADDTVLVSGGAASVHQIARAMDGSVQSATRTSGGWSGWTALGALASARPAALRLAGGDVLVCIRGAFFDLRVHSLGTPGWQILGGILTSPPVPVSWGGSRVDVFARGVDRALWRRTRVGGTWSAWESLGGQLATIPAAASTASNRLDVVALDDSGALMHRRWTGTAWTDWLKVGGKAKDEPAIVATGPDRVDVFVRGDDDQLWQITRTGSTWSPWVPRGGVLASAPFAMRALGTVVVSARDAEDVAIFAAWAGATFLPFTRFGGGLGLIPDRRQTRIFVTNPPEIAFRSHDYPAYMGGGRLAIRLADAPGLMPLEKHRRLVVEAGAVRHLASVTASRLFAASPGDAPDHVLVDFSPPLEGPVRQAVLHANIAHGSHGETQPDEPLGNGDASREFAKYRLRRSPVTYLQTGAQIAGVAELEVRVNGELWHEAPSLYARGPSERIYTARQSDAGETEITFGDGRSGARVPSGAANIVAKFRTGLGLAGNLRADQLAIPLERPVGLRSVTNPLAASGGADPEARDAARSAAPTTVRTFGRAVSLQDFAWLATASGLIARAHATWVWRTLEKAVHVTVAGPGGTRLSVMQLRTLHEALTAARDPNRVLLVANLVRVPIVVRAKVLREPDFLADDVRSAARAALLARFAFDSMPLGQAVHASDVYAALQGARGVRAVDVDLLHLKGHADLTTTERALRAVTTAPVQDHIRIFEARPTPADLSLVDRYAKAGFEGSTPPLVLSAEQAFIEDPAVDVDIAIVGGALAMAYSSAPRDKLFSLLPAYVRERDADEGSPLRALLRVIERQADLVEAELDQLHANAFIETCEPWVVPYIGDLVGTTPLFDESRVESGDTALELFPDLEGPSLRPPLVIRNRADVAKTVYYRRRKGTLPMLEELARDVTGWAAHAAEFFELLGWTQWLRNHIRPHALRTADFRSVERLDRLDRAFDEMCHTVDVRPIGQFEGRHNVRNIGFYLWRIGAYRVEAAAARRLGGAGDHRYYFSQLGQSAPLFSRLRREGDEAGLSTELHVPQPIRRARFFEDLRHYATLASPPGFSDFYGLFNAVPGFNVAPAPSMAAIVDGVPIPPERVVCRNLAAWGQPAADLIAIDVERGRLTLGPDLVPADAVEVYYHYGFPADLGGGPYRRRAWLTRRSLPSLTLIVDGTGAPSTFATINDALNEWIVQGRPDAVVRIRDNRTYAEGITIEPADGRFLAIEAADGFRPHVRLEGPLTITGNHESATITLGGLLVEGRVAIAGSLGRLRLLNTTLVPGVSIAEPDPDLPPPPPVAIEPSVEAAATDAAGEPINTELRLELAFAITGPLRLPSHAEGLFALDSIVDGVDEPAISGVGGVDAIGPATRLERVTVRGAVRVREITLASEVIFDGVAWAERVQVGCVRFSYVTPGSRLPRRYRCQPDVAERRAIEAAEAGAVLTDAQRGEIRERIRRRVRPEYTSERYGQPAYVQLALGGPLEIATGAEDGSEIGAYCYLKQPQREANLRLRLEEYLPFGLEPGVIYVT